MSFLRRDRADSPPDPPPDGISMTIDDVFWIGPPAGAGLTVAQRAVARRAPGTVLTGALAGAGTLKPGDHALHAGSRYQIVRIEVFREHVERVQPPRNVGLVLGAQVAKDTFNAGEQLRFER
ncbi:MAG: hypothetical protein ABSH51_07205 [Solirubrobacteraceae bacterium]